MTIHGIPPQDILIEMKPRLDALGQDRTKGEACENGDATCANPGADDAHTSVMS